MKTTLQAVIIVLLVIVVAFFLLVHLYNRPVSFPPQYVQFLEIRRQLKIGLANSGKYPPSGPTDSAAKPYCGAMKHCEALFGQDGFGFHEDSCFRADGMDASGARDLYSADPGPENLARRVLPRRRGRIRVLKLAEVFGPQNTGPFPPETLVLCDVYKHRLLRGSGGMPVLCYTATKACTFDSTADLAEAFDYADNLALLELGVPWDASAQHPMLSDPNILYSIIAKRLQPGETITLHSSALVSAGKDGLYGTQDDECMCAHNNWIPLKNGQ